MSKPDPVDPATLDPDAYTDRQWERIQLRWERAQARLRPCAECGFVPVHVCQMDWRYRDGNPRNTRATNMEPICATCSRLISWRARHKTVDQLVAETSIPVPDPTELPKF